MKRIFIKPQQRIVELDETTLICSSPDDDISDGGDGKTGDHGEVKEQIIWNNLHTSSFDEEW